MLEQLTEHLLPILGLGLLCAGWVAIQTWIRRREPSLTGPEGATHCGGNSHSGGSCGGSGACGGNPEDCPNGTQ